MRLPLLIVTTLSIAACPQSPPPTPTPAGSLSSLEYDLYAVIIKHQRTAIFTPESTTPVACDPDSSFNPCPLLTDGPDDEAMWAYFTVNQRAMKIDSAELARRGIKLIGPATPSARTICPPPAAVFHLSRPGFNHDSTEAVVRSSSAAGPGPFEECGYAGGQTSLYRRTPGGPWMWARHFSQWIS